MPLWTKDKPPLFHNPGRGEAVQTEAGWVDPVTGEVLVAISNLTTKSGGANATSVRFTAASYLQDDAVSVVVHFVERVDVTAGATLEAAWSGPFGNVTLTALVQDGVFDVVFTGVVPSEAGTLSVAAQNILGTIVDDLGATPAELSVSAAAAALAGSRVVV